MNGDRRKLADFDYAGVELLPGRWREQVESARAYYLAVSDDDILHGWRAAAGLPAPGRPLGGWCAKNSDVVFGQWLSGLARSYRTTGGSAYRDKAEYLLQEWGKTLRPGGDAGMDLYGYDKLLCGLVDLTKYGGSEIAKELLERTMGWAMRSFSREREGARAELINGRPGEWYTLPENVYRAYEVSRDPRYLEFAASYHYRHFWDRFAATASPPDAYHVHAYSHVNTLSSAAKAYEVTGEERFLSIVVNAYDYLQRTQCYATGGYGPMERLVPLDGTLGRSIEARANTFEAVCGSWAGLKLSRYLMELTGESRYGDWAERLLYNGVGAALPITEGGKHFYYADYRLHGGMKYYKVARYSCCSGSYFQNMAEYSNLIYFRDRSSLYVNLYLPSRAVWHSPAGEVSVELETAYPESPTIRLSFATGGPATFGLKLRIPGWSTGARILVNGVESGVACTPGRWAEIARTWRGQDVVELAIPLSLRMEPIDGQHPRRVALVRGPVVMVLDDWWMDPVPRLPEPHELDRRLLEDESPGVLRILDARGAALNPRFRPYYSVVEASPYRMYHDLDSLPIPVW